MGWLWSDSRAPPPTAAGSGPSDAMQPSSPPPAPSGVLAPDTTTPATPLPLTRDEQADLDLQALLAELSAETTSAPPSTSRPAGAAPQRNTSPIAPVRLLPSEMSCRAAFDQAWHCQLPGGQFTHMYRYGVLRNCSELWSNFWFCMRTNRGAMSAEERELRIRKHYWEREERYRKGPSSEDVWRIREDVEEKPFSGDFEEVRRFFRKEEGKKAP